MIDRPQSLLKKGYTYLLFGLLLSLAGSQLQAQHSVARKWNEVLLESIRNDFARPTVHARNLFHISVVMYDAWAAYDSLSEPYFLGDTLAGYYCPFSGVNPPTDIQAAQEEAISYAAYRMLRYRFGGSPGADTSLVIMDSLFMALGYDSSYHSTNYASDTAAALGNYLAQCMIAFGHTDGSNEAGDYENLFYEPLNPTLIPIEEGNHDILDPNRWQPLTLEVFIDQSGEPFPITTPEFLSPEWGSVVPFALQDSNKSMHIRDSDTFYVYHDPMPQFQPPYMDTLNGAGTTPEYQWGFALVSVWSSHLDPADSVMWDISPASIGNIPGFPDSIQDYPAFYDLINGGDNSQGHALNPHTGMPYAPQMVPRADYGRVLAEFWADGPDSETPPGHWFTILNYVSDHPDLEKRWKGKGPLLDDLEWDVKTYFTLSGAMHDAAISAWGIKGWYDYIRPISALRYMADQGQCSDTSQLSYSPRGIPLIPGYIEVVMPGDTLAGQFNQNVGKIKILAWKGPDYITSPQTDVAGVDWILAGDWWPYQRPSFVTPPFAGYVSGHSTYSRAAAEIMTLMTGDAFFPGGMGEFHAPMNEFLVFEDGPSVNVTLQWATYRDASDQCSLSRIWGGIHPPADDIPGRIIGEVVGVDAFNYASQWLNGNGKPDVLSINTSLDTIADIHEGTATFSIFVEYNEGMDLMTQPEISFPAENPLANTLTYNADSSQWVNDYIFEARFDVANSDEVIDFIDIQVQSGANEEGAIQDTFRLNNRFFIETENPMVQTLALNTFTLTDTEVGNASLELFVLFNESMDISTDPQIQFPVEDPLANSLVFNPTESFWFSENVYQASFDLLDANETLNNIDIEVSGARDKVLNSLVNATHADVFQIDTENPIISLVSPDPQTISDNSVGSGAFTMYLNFSENMDMATFPLLSFPQENPLANSLSFNPVNSQWINSTTFAVNFDVADGEEQLDSIDISVSNTQDANGNDFATFSASDQFHIDTRNPAVSQIIASTDTIGIDLIGSGTFHLRMQFDEAMDPAYEPKISFPVEDPLAGILYYNPDSSYWVNESLYQIGYDVASVVESLYDIDVQVGHGRDMIGNLQAVRDSADLFHIDLSDLNNVSVEEALKLQPQLRVRPNPVLPDAQIIADLHFQGSSAVLEMSNVQGQLVHYQVLNQQGTGQEVHISTAGLAEGMYFVQLKSDGQQRSVKVIVQK